MNRIFNRGKRLTTRLLAAVLTAAVCMAEPLSNAVVMAAVQNPTEAPTMSDVSGLFQKYDTDVYNIVETSGDNFLFWFPDDFVSDFESAVHETYHTYTFHTARINSEYIYVGGNVGYTLQYSGDTYFKTEKMAKKIPQKLRTFRYSTYVAEGATASANAKGAYGLMNEFSAYYWGLQVTSSLMGYYREYANETSVWQAYATSVGNNMTAYAEFKYWILRYMIYAKKNKPAAYKAILADSAFCNAYTAIETQFAELIEENKSKLSEVNEYLESYGISIEWSDSSLCAGTEGSSRGVELDDYNLMMNELQKDSYTAMDKTIKKHATDSTAKITINNTRSTLSKGDSVTLKLKHTKKSVTWKSSNKKIAAVNSKGKVTAKSKGVCIISGTVGKRTFYCTVNVE